ncbi:rod shape-determining protein MreC [Xenococcus sp. PCC 7305]|uniref:rod shape-determining protein MreC n=1 Tax=Xenococcus sp. PCC 7305 TaxID=102125 RepID=UPI0002ABA91D|nr:rod shape-determining protein MreC [Xenococcus sp. PCC 7305]ELS01447.1 rod shape-determining protein MreC [Xenococcus sp. PCC 7305]
MSSWSEKHSLSIAVTMVVLGCSWLLKQTQMSPVLEAYYLATSPLQSQRQLLLEDKLTNARILELEQKNEELEHQNSQFKELLDYIGPKSASAIPAPIIGRYQDGWWHQIIIGRGSNDSIQEGYVVTGIGGIVGRIVAVTPNTSRVQLVSHPSSRVGVVVTRSRHLGYLQGHEGKTATMHFFAKVTDIKTGDAVSISPLSNLYPPGMAIGKIVSVTYDEGPAPKAEVELTAPLDSLEWLVVQPFQPNIFEQE